MFDFPMLFVFPRDFYANGSVVAQVFRSDANKKQRHSIVRCEGGRRLPKGEAQRAGLPAAHGASPAVGKNASRPFEVSGGPRVRPEDFRSGRTSVP